MGKPQDRKSPVTRGDRIIVATLHLRLLRFRELTLSRSPRLYVVGPDTNPDTGLSDFRACILDHSAKLPINVE